MTRLVATSLAVALATSLAIFAIAVVVGQHISLPGRQGVSVALAAVLVALAPLDWIPVVLIVRMVRRAPDVTGLQHQLSRLLFEALTASLLGTVGLSYVLGLPLPSGAGFVILVLALLLVSAPPVHWLLETYRRA